MFAHVASGMCGSITARGKHSRGGPFGAKIFEFCFLKRLTLVYFIFLSDGGAPNIAGPGVTYLYPLPTGLPVTDVLAFRTAKPPLRLSGPDRC